jgi:hypothetical protein
MRAVDATTRTRASRSWRRSSRAPRRNSPSPRASSSSKKSVGDARGRERRRERWRPSTGGLQASRSPSHAARSDSRARRCIVPASRDRFASLLCGPRRSSRRCWDASVYLASIRTMYRFLAMHFGVVPDRRAQRRVRHNAPPSLEGTLPNQVWTWGITKVAGPSAAFSTVSTARRKSQPGWLCKRLSMPARERAAMTKSL